MRIFVNIASEIDENPLRTFLLLMVVLYGTIGICLLVIKFISSYIDMDHSRTPSVYEEMIEHKKELQNRLEKLKERAEENKSNPPEKREIPVLTAKEMMDIQKYRKRREKKEKMKEEMIYVLDKIACANNKGKKRIEIKKKDLPRVLKNKLRREGYIVEDKKGGCFGSSMKVIKWGLDIARDVVDELEDFDFDDLFLKE